MDNKDYKAEITRTLRANKTRDFELLSDLKLAKRPEVKNLEDNLASEFYNRIVELINVFERTLYEQEEVGMRLVTFGNVKVFHLTDLGYYNPSIITFGGIDENNKPLQLIQHVTQISLLLTALPKLDPNMPKRRIGFHIDELTPTS